MEYVIIGNSTAAVGCIEGIRTVDKTGKITVISDEKHHAYSRPLISYLLCGKTTEDRMKYRPDSFYSDNNVDTLLGETVKTVDTQKKQVVTVSGIHIKYDRLMVATGSSPFLPPAEGYDEVENKFTFMTLDSAKALRDALTPESRVLVVGAGLIGLKCVEGILDLCCSITVIDLADRVMPSVLDGYGAELVKKHIEAHGVKFILSDCVVKYENGTAFTKGGKEIGFDVLVTAVGVRPNVSLVKDAGGRVERGIVTDERCATSLDGIYAAGDCTESFDVSCGERRILAILPNAYMQGFTGGVNMAGGNSVYKDAIPQNAIGFFGYHMITAGSVGKEERVYKNGDTYKKLMIKDGRLIGFIMIGDIERAGIYTALIRNKTPLDTIDFELIAEKPQLMAFSNVDRKKMLGGAKQ